MNGLNKNYNLVYLLDHQNAVILSWDWSNNEQMKWEVERCEGAFQAMGVAMQTMLVRKSSFWKPRAASTAILALF